MTKQTITIRQATLQDTEKVTQFRIDQFRTAKEFELLSIDPLSQMKGQVLIAEFENEIISTMQFQKISNHEELVANETEYIPDTFDYFETFYLSKGGTKREFRNTGINSYLRKIILEIAIDNSAINSLTGTAYENAPRINTLKRIGYNITDTYTVKTDYIKATEKPLFLSLERQNFLTAIEFLETESVELKNNYNIINKMVC